MNKGIVFGTDGWRGRIAADYTFENVRRCAHGFARYLISLGFTGEWVIVGYDKRFQSEDFAAAAAEVLVGNGLNVFLTEAATPTPVISYSVLQKKAIGAVNITASHNPPIDNGFKVRDRHGGAIDPEGLKEIENRIPDDTSIIKHIKLEQAINDGSVIIFDPAPDYINHIKQLVALDEIKKSGIKVLVDCMWGNGSGWLPRLISGGETKIIEIHNDRNPCFPEMTRPEPIPPNINVGLKTTVEVDADVLIVFDGDADRLGVGDEDGNFVNQLRVFGLMAYYLLEIRKETGPIVKTLSTTTMLNKLGAIYNVPVYETGVGFKYVAPKMLEVGAMIGGEESGGYAFRGNVPERDGILAALYLLDMMIKTGKSPKGLLELLFEKVGEHYYDRIDVPFAGTRADIEKNILDAKPERIGGLKVTSLQTIDGYQFHLEDGGWLLIRFSGTEPIIRVYCETTHEKLVVPILEHGLKIAGLK